MGLLLRFPCALAHALGEDWDVCVCVRRGGLSERSSDVEVVVSQISGGDGVSVGGGCGRDEEGEGKEGRRGDEGWCVPAGCVMEGRSKLPPSLLPLCRFTCHLHGVVTVRVCDLGGGCTPCTPCTACDLHTSDAHPHFFSPPPRCPTLHVQARQCSCDAVWL